MSQRLRREDNNPDDEQKSLNNASSERDKALELEKYFPESSLLKSFSHAFYGIKETWLCERNFKIHTICATISIALGIACKLETANWLALILVISLVLSAELINTALEHLVDLAADSLYHPLAKAAKDASAGAVLIASGAAFSCGLIIFLPHLLKFYREILSHCWQ